MKTIEIIQQLQSKIDTYKFLLYKFPDLKICKPNGKTIYFSDLVFNISTQNGNFNKVEMDWCRETLYFVYVFPKSEIQIRSKQKFRIDYDKHLSFNDCLNQWNFSDEIQLKIKDLLNKDDISEIDEDLRDNND